MTISGRQLSIVLVALLILLAVSGNYYHLTLFDGELRYLLGSTFSLLALRLFGFTAGLLVALCASAMTVIVWQHPLGFVIYPLEIVIVHFFIGRYGSSLLLAAMFYWLMLGAPLIWGLLSVTGLLASELLTIVALKHAVNGVLNAFLAEIVYTLLRFHRPSRLRLRLNRLRIPDVIFFSLLLSMTIPVTAILLNFPFVASTSDLAIWLTWLIVMIIVNMILAKAISSWFSGHLARLALVGSAEQRLIKHDLEEFTMLGKALGTVSDALERRAQDQQTHTQTILDNIIDGIITIDAKGSVLSYNRSAERIFGYPEQAVLGRNVSMLMPEPYHGEHDSYLENYRVTGNKKIIGKGREVQGRHQNGTVFPLDLMVTEISRNDQPVFIGTVRDISERKKVDRLKNEFVSTVSHELRTPLTAICGSLGLISAAQPGGLEANALNLLDIAQNNCKRLGHLIEDLLDIESLASGRMTMQISRESITELVGRAVSDSAALALKADVEIVLGRRDQALVDVDERRFTQIMSNLLSNAIKFSPRQSSVLVEQIVRDGKIRVSVQDYGPGVPAAFHSRIFSRFAQADSSDLKSHGGAGLGLAISRELAEQMSGSMGFDSIEGKGATFYVELPVQLMEDITSS
ncbi:sensor histidine kinase [Pseudohongiella spirulinae]|uniref:Sensor protein FixL n=1 Tax=Pseudohongiella spirulinae TaxID=1249552 RepID=A0A0S2KF29_9GAMM|nr:PAS domain S-box protein [Pseudohongiella spirulinae]ALO46890.1 hypothetical protein PS2015_2255 [Pseudohongiella spirulinae]